MKVLMRKLFIAIMLLGFMIPVAGGTSGESDYKIALGEFGNSDYAAEFRLLVEDELLGQGITVVQMADQPEAIFSGVVTPFGPHRLPNGLLRLRQPGGKILWRYDFPTGFRNHKSSAEAKYLVDLLVQAMKDGFPNQ